MALNQWLRAAADVLMPRTCSVCGTTLGADEPYVCRGCMAHLPRTRLEQVEFNTMEQLFAGKVPIERAAGFFYYEKDSPYASIIHDAKYRNMPKLGQWIAGQAYAEMKGSGFFEGIEVVVPVPLHRDKLASRGYNQTLYIARGIARAAGIAVAEAVKAARSHSTQTRKGALERWQNTRGMYCLKAGASTALEGKRVLVVDDVVTTGSTLEACAEALLAVPGVKISLFTLAVARLS
ncbi:MAG TPA: amidophosphoribosyltransferase [Porphyromonadaceae bacterium]|nr:amidophosphoribosyltransferase [Porphyromonadaceae bacterium]